MRYQPVRGKGAGTNASRGGAYACAAWAALMGEAPCGGVNSGAVKHEAAFAFGKYDHIERRLLGNLTTHILK